MTKKKSILEEIYKMDIDTLRKYCIQLLRNDAKHFRENHNNDLIKVCPLCKDELQKIDGIAFSFNGLCKDCAKATYIVWRDCVGDRDKPAIKS